MEKWSSLSITHFIKQLPEHLPVLSKHIIKLKSTAESAEVELFRLFSKSLSSNSQYHTNIYGVILLEPLITDTEKLLGIISSVPRQDTLILQVVDASLIYSTSTPSYNPLSFNSIPPVDFDTWSDYPVEILNCCQQYQATQNKEQLEKLINKIYNIASLYGYWDIWRVLEGICHRFNIDPNQFLNQ
ncbi:unnamed protein product [Cunninghamella echinulata]